MSLATVLLVFQMVYLLNAVCLLFVFVLQTLAEKHQDEKLSSTNIKKRLHVIGIAVAILILALSIDPFGQHGLYTDLVIYLFEVNTSAFFIAALVFIAEASARVVYKAQFLELPKHITYTAWGLILSTFVVGNLCGVLGSLLNKAYITGAFVIWLGLVVAATAITLLLTHHYIMGHLVVMSSANKGRQSVSDVNREKQQAVMKLKVAVITGFALVFTPLEIYTGIMRFKNRTESFPTPNLEKFDFYHNHAFTLTKIAAAWFLFAYAFVPFASKPKKDASEQDETSTTTASRSREQRKASVLGHLEAQSRNKLTSHTPSTRGNSESVAVETPAV